MFRRQSLPRDVIADLARQVEGGRVLAWAVGAGDAVAVALDSAFAVRRDGVWEVHGWHLLQGGGWNRDSSALRWTTNTDERGSVVLDEPGRLPEVFNERMMASIVVQQNFDAPGGGRVMVAGRRPLGGAGEGATVWQVVTHGRAKLDDPEVRAFLLERTAELKEQYDL
ncbi:hypothetical protein ACSDQ9_03295 [Aestuariimicrobium soli]|uniref:hypothetical protein n=1 Tax=Aestuariimicrobium soli TaxID=2035834 RepID=UPI003EBDB431